MEEQRFIDHYETLQLSPNADSETIAQVYRFMATRFELGDHMNGDVERLQLVRAANAVLSDSRKRCEYDVRYHEQHPEAAHSVEGAVAGEEFETYRQLRRTILVNLYNARRSDDSARTDDYSLERRAGCSPGEMRFNLWYMTAKGWIERTDEGRLSITADGVDQLG